MRNKWSDPNFAPIILALLFIMGVCGAGVILVLLDFIFNLGLT
jgi:hypothetical protein